MIVSINGSITNKKQTPAREYAEALAVALPAEGGVVLSDDVRKLTLVRSVLKERGAEQKFLFIDSQSLTWVDYHSHLERKQPRLWKNFVPPGAKGQIEGGSLVQILHFLSQSNAVYYLHPSFGYYFEAFWMEPRGVSYLLRPFPTNSLLAPRLGKAVLDYNQEFWTRADENAVGRLLRLRDSSAVGTKDTFADRLLRKARLKPHEPRDNSVIASFYSRARNTWAVEIQKADQWGPGVGHLQKALELNPANRVARVNLEFNQHHQTAGSKMPDLSDEVQDLFGYRSWDQLMNENGPFDEPRFCFEQGRIFARGNLFRQAANQFNRVRDLAPGHLQSRLWLAQVYVITRLPDSALEIVREIRGKGSQLGLSSTNALEMMAIEASALLLKGEAEKAAETVNAALKQNPKDQDLLVTATQVFMNYGQFTNALELVERQLKVHPDNIAALVNKGFAMLQMKRYEQSIPPLSRVLELETNTSSELHQSALFNRAIAYLQSGKLDDARRDYEALQKLFPGAFKLNYGLGEIAYRQQDTNAALSQYQLYLSNAPTNTQEAEFVRQRISELNREQP